MDDTKERQKICRINFRLPLYCAIFLCFGIFLTGRIRFGGFTPSDLVFFLVFLLLSLPPLLKERTLAICFCCVIFSSLGAGALSMNVLRFEDVFEEGTYIIEGTVESVSYNGACAVIENLSFNGKKTGGKCRIYLTNQNLYPAERIRVTAKATPASLKDEETVKYDFAHDIRYTASANFYETVGYSKNPFLRINAALLKTLKAHMGKEESGIAYALLTGNSGEMDLDFLTIVRRGGIAHIFAVSGLHIGILFGAIWAVCFPLRKYRVIPALASALCYAAFCNFTVSSLRAVIMCFVLGTARSFGKKYDFLNSISYSAIFILLLFPAEWFSAGFRLSFGACLGLALFSGSFVRMFTRLHFPAFLGKYLSANLSVQIFILPIQLESFGFVSVWAAVLNFFVIPALPILFLGLILVSLIALILPPTAGFLLTLPDAVLSVSGMILSSVDFSLVLRGFTLGIGASVWLLGCFLLSERVRLKRWERAVAAVFLSVLFTVLVTLQNVVFWGCKIEIYSEDGETLALISTRSERVLLLDGDISFKDCQTFLDKTYGGVLDAAVVLSKDELRAINTAAFLPAEKIYAKSEIETGLRETEIVFGETFSCGSLSFRYAANEKLFLFAEGLLVEFEFGQNRPVGGDLFVSEACGGLKYFLRHGIIRTL